MEKITRRFDIDYSFDWAYSGVEIKKLREDLDAAEKLGATHVEIEMERDYGCDRITIQAYVDRIETDEECKARIDEQNKRQEEVKRRELAQLELLKSKYGI